MAYDPIQQLIDRIVSAKKLPTLAWGDRAPEIPLVRHLLGEKPAPGAPDMSKDYDQALAQKVRAFQENLHLTADGVIGPSTWAAFTVRDWQSLNELTLFYAVTELLSGAQEIGGQNKGAYVKKYMGPGGEGQPWCAGFATWCYQQACGRLGIEAQIKQRWSSSGLVSEAITRGLFRRTPGKPGSFVVVKGGGTKYRHTAILRGVKDGYALVWEGNVRPLKPWYSRWQLDMVRPGKYPLSKVVFIDLDHTEH